MRRSFREIRFHNRASRIQQNKQNTCLVSDLSDVKLSLNPVFKTPRKTCRATDRLSRMQRMRRILKNRPHIKERYRSYSIPIIQLFDLLKSLIQFQFFSFRLCSSLTIRLRRTRTSICREKPYLLKFS